MKYILYFYIGTFRSKCVVSNMSVLFVLRFRALPVYYYYYYYYYYSQIRFLKLLSTQLEISSAKPILKIN